MTSETPPRRMVLPVESAGGIGVSVLRIALAIIDVVSPAAATA